MLTELTSATGKSWDELRGQREAVVEVAVDLQQLGAVHERLGQLAQRDLALRHEHRAGQPGPGRVRGGGGAGVAGGGADDRLGALLDRLGDGHGHAPVLEGAGRVGALHLEVDVAARARRTAPAPARSGVLPSCSVTTGVASVTGSRSRYASISPRHMSLSSPLPPRPPEHQGTLDNCRSGRWHAPDLPTWRDARAVPSMMQRLRRRPRPAARWRSTGRCPARAAPRRSRPARRPAPRGSR